MRVVAWQEGRWHEVTGLGRAEVRQLALGPVPVWIRAESVAETDWDDLAAWFDLHPLAMEDIRGPRQRPKVEAYGDVTFIVLRAPRYHDGALTWAQVGVFLGADFVLTATADAVPELDTIQARLLAGGWRGDEGHVDRVMYHIVDALVDTFFPLVDALEDDLDELEEQVVEKADREGIARIRDVKSMVSRLRKVVLPMREAALNLERAPHANISAATRVYLRDVSDHMVRIGERLEHVKEVALIGQEMWNSTLATQQNAAMKRLTVLFSLFLIPTFLASVGGMNFGGIPQWPFWRVTVVLLGFVAVGFLVALWRRWL